MYEAANRCSNLESEVTSAETRISNLEAESAQYEAQAKQGAQELATANEAIVNYMELNDTLCIKIEKLESVEKTAAKEHKDKQSDELAESLIKADGLQERVHVLEEIERDLQA